MTRVQGRWALEGGLEATIPNSPRGSMKQTIPGPRHRPTLNTQASIGLERKVIAATNQPDCANLLQALPRLKLNRMGHLPTVVETLGFHWICHLVHRHLKSGLVS
jgi:hypothetical protein